jgi:Reverse transcriptase (RNA-dependent DNA polymerase)
MAAAEGMEIHQMDVKTAFLNGDLEEDIYMEQPEGMVEEGQEDKVCRLKKPLYGLKQGSRCWNIKIDGEMITEGFTRCSSDRAVYFRGEGKSLVVIPIYVDDISVYGYPGSEIQRAKDFLRSKWEMTDLGRVHYLLGIEITEDDDCFSLSQSKYIREVLARFQMTDCTPISTPMETGVKLSKGMEPVQEWEKKDMEGVPYKEAVGSLMYLMVATRPDIAAAVGAVSQFMQNPGPEHWAAVVRILRYLQGTQNVGLKFFKSAEKVEIHGYVDADYAGDYDSKKSTTGCSSGAISWSSKKQSTVALSSTESEYMAATSASKEALWLRSFFGELGFGQKTTTVWSDNQSSIALMKNPVYHAKTKHIDIQFHFIRDLVASGALSFRFVPTARQAADNLAKAVPRDKVKICNDLVGVVAINKSG